VSDHTQPTATGLHSLASAIIGARLNLDQQRSDEAAKLIWFVILSHTPWESLTRPTWATDTTLANDAGMKGLRDVERAVARLRTSDMLTTTIGHRPGARRPTGRVLCPRIGAPVKVLIPDRGSMANLWITCREVQSRPAPMVTLAVGLYVLACHEVGHRPEGWTRIPGTMSDVRRFVGARKGHAWTRRIRDMEALGLLGRPDGEIWVAPAIAWDQTARALARVRARG